MQHDPEVSLPYLLVHDNGEARVGGTNYSRVVEYELDIENRVVTKRWDWTEPGWYETVFGDADRLPGDHVLITQGHCFICPHGDPSRYSALTEVDQSTDEVVWRLSMEEPQPGLYRAQRLDGCELFSNRKYCEALR